MSQTSSNSARQASLARRKALSTTGKAAMGASAERTRTAPPAKEVAAVDSAVVSSAPAAPVVAISPAPQQAVQGSSARKAALQRRIAMSKGGKGAVSSADRTRSAPANKAPTSAVAAESNDGGCGCGCKGKSADVVAAAATASDLNLGAVAAAPQISPNLKKVAMNSTRAATLARRKAMSTKGKAALKGGTVSEASAARAANPNISSRELAQALRASRSQKGKTQNKTAGVKATGPGRHRKAQDAAQDAPWKVGVTETASGQAVTGTMVDRTEDVTGTEASTCRAITGTEYMGADVFKDYCQADAVPSFNRVSVTSTGSGNRISGNNVNRSTTVTGNEPGTCKTVTGTEYVSTEQAQAFCASKSPTKKPPKITMAETAKGKVVTGDNVGRSEKVTGDEPGSDRTLTGSQYMSSGQDTAPNKVAISSTLRGGSVSGTTVGRSASVTGDEAGSCRNVTGDDYVSAEQYAEFCKSTPSPSDQKVGVSSTLLGKDVTGTMTDRGGSVTGNEAGTCKALTGTPYVGVGQTEAYCSSPEKSMAMARAQKGTGNVGRPMTGIQPGIGGVMTGDSKGACEPLTGTAYIGADQAAAVCPATAATTASPDYPQPVGGQPWNDFSVSSPASEAREVAASGAITGTAHGNGHITGPFGMADGKVTGTEEARFGKANMAAPEAVVAMANEVDGRVVSRITGEGQDAGMKVTGDDWDRGDSVTGTEGRSATLRNPTVRGSVMPSSMSVSNKRNEETALPISKVTGSSGNTENGSLITYSGGARG